MPLIPDTLNTNWQSYLKECGISCKSGLQLDVSDKEEVITSSLTTDNKWFKSPLLDCTIGYRCEIEVMGYLDYGFWQFIGTKELGYVLLYCLFIVGILNMILYIERRLNRPPIVKITQVSTIELVKDTDKGAIRTYRLGDSSIFYAKQKKIVTNDTEEKISPQNSALLECFLNAKDYKLSDDEIMECLWPNGSGTSDRLHQAIKRLREALKMEPQIYIVRIGVSAYQMYM